MFLEEGIALFAQVGVFDDVLIGQRDIVLALPVFATQCRPALRHGTLEVGGTFARRGVDMLENGHGDGAIAFAHGNSPDALRGAPRKNADGRNREPYALAT